MIVKTKYSVREERDKTILVCVEKEKHLKEAVKIIEDTLLSGPGYTRIEGYGFIL